MAGANVAELVDPTNMKSVSLQSVERLKLWEPSPETRSQWERMVKQNLRRGYLANLKRIRNGLEEERHETDINYVNLRGYEVPVCLCEVVLYYTSMPDIVWQEVILKEQEEEENARILEN